MSTETAQLLNVIETINQVQLGSQQLERLGNLAQGDDGDIDRDELNAMFLALFDGIFSILQRMSDTFCSDKLVESVPQKSLFDESALLQLPELLTRMQSNLNKERNKSEEIINFLRHNDFSEDDPCKALLEKVRQMESLYVAARDKLKAAVCENEILREQLNDRQAEISQLAQQLVDCCSCVENLKADLFQCRNGLKRSETNYTEMKEKCEEYKRCAEQAVDQTSLIASEKDQTQKLVDHLQLRLTSIDRDNTSLLAQLRDCELKLSELTAEKENCQAELGRALERERETHNNVNKIMQECSERIKTETDRIKERMNQELETLQSVCSRLELDNTQWKLKYDQLMRDYRNIEGTYSQLNASIANSSQCEAMEKNETARRLAAAECARDEAIFTKQKLSLKLEKVELALSKLTERCNADNQAKQQRIDELQKKIGDATDDLWKCQQDRALLDKELTESKEQCIELEMRYRFRISAAQNESRTVQRTADAKMSALEEGYKKTMNDLSRELNNRQAVINRLLEDKRRRCSELEEQLSQKVYELSSEHSRNQELTRIKNDQSRRINYLEDEMARLRKQAQTIPRK